MKFHQQWDDKRTKVGYANIQVISTSGGPVTGQKWKNKCDIIVNPSGLYCVGFVSKHDSVRSILDPLGQNAAPSDHGSVEWDIAVLKQKFVHCLTWSIATRSFVILAHWNPLDNPIEAMWKNLALLSVTLLVEVEASREIWRCDIRDHWPFP